MNQPIGELIHGESLFADDGLSAAINETVYAAREASGVTLVILNDHLKQLCEMQRAALAPTPLIGV